MHLEGLKPSQSVKLQYTFSLNIIPIKDRISLSINSTPLDTSCSLCSHFTDSLVHLFFSCPIARVIWRNSFLPLDITALHISSMADWLNIIPHPETIGISTEDSHRFHIFTVVACNQIWFDGTKLTMMALFQMHYLSQPLLILSPIFIFQPGQQNQLQPNRFGLNPILIALRLIMTQPFEATSLPKLLFVVTQVDQLFIVLQESVHLVHLFMEKQLQLF
jgi:hypothetical protein